MRPLAAIAPALILAASLGAPALAAVDAPRALVAPAEAEALAKRLDRLGEYHFDVVIVKSLAEAPEVVARQMFLAHQKGPYDGLIVVTMGDRRAGAHLGDKLRGRGLDDAALAQVVSVVFAPRAATGDVLGGIEALASAIATYDPAHPPTLAPTESPTRLPWEGALAALAAAAAGFAGARAWRVRAEQQRRLPPLQRRLTDLKLRRGHVIKALAPLAAAARFEGAVSDAWTPLRERLRTMAWSLTEDAEFLSLGFGRVEAALDAGKPTEAEAELDALHSRTWLIEAGVAALSTGLTALSRMAAPGTIAAALDVLKGLAVDWLEVRALLAERQAHQHENGFLGVEADQLTQQAREVLTTAPVDGVRAETLLREAAQQLGRSRVTLSATRPRPTAGETAWETAPYVVTRIVPRAEGTPAPARGPNGTHELS
jgi:uncharacterized membrane protein YgcG